MKKTNCKQGFTLIELLVVVLIIGILAAVAVPQYQKAVEKSKASQALALLTSLGNAMETYYLANGVYPSKFEQMDVDFSAWSGKESWLDDDTTHTQDVFSNQDWTLALVHLNTEEVSTIQMGRLTGPWQGGGWNYSSRFNEITCVERTTGKVKFLKKQGDYCTKLFGKTNPQQKGGQVFFN